VPGGVWVREGGTLALAGELASCYRSSAAVRCSWTCICSAVVTSVERRVEVTPAGPFRLPRAGMDGTLRRRGGVLERLLHHDGEPVLVRIAQTAPDQVLFGARSGTDVAAAHGIERMRFALGVDEDLSTFHRRFARDPLIGRSITRRPWLRVSRRPEPFEALAWAVCEQLIEYERAATIERRLLAALGRRWIGRALTLVRAAREVARGRVDLHSSDHEHGWRRLRAIPGIGCWTIEMLALQGQGRHDQVPAGDVGLLKLVGRLLGGGDPYARAQEHEVREFFAPYEEWAGLAATHMYAL
jgi:3-methyladenine DNA glycosylase/8-oxoguanine DNA glycosylase